IELSFERFLSSVDLDKRIPQESDFQTLFLFAMALADQSVKIEEALGEGFLEASLKIPQVGRFIIGIKYIKADEDYSDEEYSDDQIREELDKKALEVSRQIDNRKYFFQYSDLGYKVYKMAIVVYKRAIVRVIIDKIV
ncbi:MAG: PD-(D/E)XK nuclease domain-containing protein, partial [Deltaproteobacteria bacterium]|nr:PD-(D/E)XK nuclease domain-containing protein [Deltaproteobacteria bacterium]